MPLVDYASSDEDISEDGGESELETLPPATNSDDSWGSGLVQNQHLPAAPHQSASSVDKLPDVSFLLNSPNISLINGTDHASRVAAAAAENLLRKRASSGMQSPFPCSKLPRGPSHHHTRNVPDTVSGVLMPPQLSGRSNIVTEDIGVLFVRKRPNSSSN